jgi:hypothetical protein
MEHSRTDLATKFDAAGLRNDSISSKEARDELYHQWRVFRIRYTTCHLTKYQDKLVALEGIADMVGEVLEDEPVAGPWKNRLSQDLCWFKSSFWGNHKAKSKPVAWTAPT